MGSCVGKKKPSIKAAPILKPLTETPTVFIEENFKLIDYSHHIKEMTNFSNIRRFIENYRLSDIRCVKRINEDNEVHSSVIIISNHIKQDNLLEELSLVVQYSLYGFALTLGDLNSILNYCSLQKSSMEMIHLPRSDAVGKGGLVEVIEWAFEHKDEKFKNPGTTPELDMGRRIFQYTVGLFDNK